MNVAALLAAMQYADSTYPAGGFAQSWGLETAVAEREVADARDLEAACRVCLQHQVGPADAVAAAACCRLAGGSLEAFTAIDRRLSATRAAAEARLASGRMGRRLIDTAVEAEGDGWLAELQRHVHAGSTPGNHACMLGAVVGRLGLSPAEAAALALWTAANGLLAAAVRLLPVTHDDVQAILARVRPLIDELATTAASSDSATLATGAPMLELWAMRHETASVRLFSS